MLQQALRYATPFVFCILFMQACVDKPTPPRDRYNVRFCNDLFHSGDVGLTSLGVVEVRVYSAPDLGGFIPEAELKRRAQLVLRTNKPDAMAEIIHAVHSGSRISAGFEYKDRRDAEWHIIAEDSTGRKAYVRCIESRFMDSTEMVVGYAPITYFVKCNMRVFLGRLGGHVLPEGPKGGH